MPATFIASRLTKKKKSKNWLFHLFIKKREMDYEERVRLRELVVEVTESGEMHSVANAETVKGIKAIMKKRWANVPTRKLVGGFRGPWM